MAGRRAQSNQIFPIQSEARDPIGDAFFCLWRCRPDVAAQLFKGDPLLGTNGREIFGNGGWLGH